MSIFNQVMYVRNLFSKFKVQHLTELCPTHVMKKYGPKITQLYQFELYGMSEKKKTLSQRLDVD